MDPWEPDKVAQLIALIATGFAARWAYTTQVPPRDEEHTITIVWAAVWSGVIATIVQVVHFKIAPCILHLLPPDSPDPGKEHLVYVNAYKATALIINLFTFSVLGYVMGRINVAVTASVREYKMEADRGFRQISSRFFGTLFSAERGFKNSCQYFLESMADRKWVLIETEQGIYLGFVRVHDSREEDKFYLVLHEPCMFDDILKGFPSEAQWPAMMFRSDEIKSIALYKPPM